MIRSCLLILSFLIVAAHAHIVAADTAPRQEIRLDGPWQLSPIAKASKPFSLDDQIATGAWQREADTSGWSTIDLPTMAGFYTPDSPALPDGVQKGQSYWFGRSGGPTYNAAWYRRSFDAPTLADGQRLFLKFMSVGAEAHVWVNGTKVGDHFGAFTGFEFDITDAVTPGASNTVAVYCTTDFGERPMRRVYGKMFFAHNNTGGIIGPAALEVRPDLAVKRALITPRLEGSRIEIDYTIDNRSQKPRQINVQVRVQDRQIDIGNVTAGPGLSQHRATVQIENPILWSPQTPHLYDLNLALLDSGRVIDQINERFGMREFVVRDGKFFLNGVRTRLYIGNTLTLGQFRYYEPAEQERFRQWVKRQMAQGVNTIRYHMGGTDSYLMLRICDELGMLVINEWPWFHRVESGITDPAARERFYKTNDYEMEQWLYRDYNSPSNIMWSLSNEVWTKAEVPLLDHSYEHMRPLDRSTRPMSADSGFHSVIRELPVKTDLYDLHNYTMHSTYPWSLVREGVNLDFDVIAKIYGKVDKPVIITESLNLPKFRKSLSVPLSPGVYLENAQLPGIREIGLAAVVDPQRGYPYLIETFGVRTLEQFRQDSRIQGISPWFGDRDHLPDSIRFVYGPYYVGFVGLHPNARAGAPWQGEIHVAKDPLEPRTLTARLAIVDASNQVVHEQTWPVELAAEQETASITYDWSVPSTLSEGNYQAQLQLLDGQEIIARNRAFIRILSDETVTAAPAVTSVALYDPAGDSILGGLLEQHGIQPQRITQIEQLDRFQVLILAPGWGPELAPAGETIAKWIETGGRLVAFETNHTTDVPWAPAMKIVASSAMRQPFVDLVEPDHGLFAGLKRDHFDGWNGNHQLITSALITPLSLNTLAAAGAYSGEGQLTAVTEAGIGKGSFVMTQLLAVERYETDPVAARYVQNVLRYVLGAPPRVVRPLQATTRGALLESLRRVKAEACIPIDLRAVVNTGLEATIGDSATLDLRHVPVGRQSWHGIPFNVIDPAANSGKAVLLMQGNRTPDRPQRASINVGRNAQRIFFLHTAYYATANVMGRYVVHYNDGSRIEVPVDGKTVGDWYRPTDKDHAVVAWAEAHPVVNSATVGCYLYPWTNPHPKKTINRIEVVSEGSEQQAGGSIMLLGVTIEPPTK